MQSGPLSVGLMNPNFKFYFETMYLTNKVIDHQTCFECRVKKISIRDGLSVNWSDDNMYIKC